MKKAINKTERDEILIALVAQAASLKAQAVIDTLVVLRKQLHEILLGNWQDNFPGISREDQLSLLNSLGGRSLSFIPAIYTKGEGSDALKNIGEFGKLTWANPGTNSVKALVSRIATRIFQNCNGTSGVFYENISTGYSSHIDLSSIYPDLLNGMQPSILFCADVDLPDGCDPVVNDLLLDMYYKIRTQLEVFKNLVYSAEDAYQALGAAIAPIKTAQQLAELFPEAVKHFPTSLTYIKPTKELADPKAINEIRAKLKKGLPI